MGGANRCRDMSSPTQEVSQRIAPFVLWLAVALAAPVARAQGVAPDALLRAVSVDVIDEIKQDQLFQTAGPAKITALVETRIMPLFDFVHMTRLAMARHWGLATPEQQREITAEFKTLLQRTYATALANYRAKDIHRQGDSGVTPPKT